MREVRATTGAVSQRNILAPIEQMCAPVCRAASASDGSKPPSGPVIIAAVVSSFASLSASESASRLPVSYMNRALSHSVASLSICPKPGIHETVGIIPLPDCFAASSDILFQRSNFFDTPSVRWMTRSESKKTISDAPASTHF